MSVRRCPDCGAYHNVIRCPRCEEKTLKATKLAYLAKEIRTYIDPERDPLPEDFDFAKRVLTKLSEF